MNICPAGIIESNIVNAARAGKIFPHMVCGVDVYKRPETALEDNGQIDQLKSYSPESDMFFSGRHYRIIHLLDPDEYDPRSTIAEVKNQARQLRMRGAGVLLHDVLEQQDRDVAYVLTPLRDAELVELLKPN